MKFINSIPLLVAGLGLSSAQTPTNPTLEEKWNLVDPIFNYTNKEFTLTYRFSDMFATTDADTDDKTLATIYLAQSPDDLAAADNCKVELSATNTNDNSYASNGKGYLSISEGGITANPDTNAPYTVKKQETVSITLITNGIETDTSIFSEPDGGGNATIAFCVRYGLYTEKPGIAGSYEVNFLESLVIFDIDLTAGFDVAGIQVAPKNKLKRTANQSYELEAYQCKADDPTVEVTQNPDDETDKFNQGDVITVCVRPDETARLDNIYMKRIEEFTYTLMDGDDPTIETGIKQKAIDVDDTSSGDYGEMYGLTSINNCQGLEVCIIETILFATFYTRAGVVSGSGTGTMQFGSATGSRMLRGDRSLEEAEAASSEFDVNFQIASNDAFQGASGASSCMTVLALFGSVAAALVL